MDSFIRGALPVSISGPVGIGKVSLLDVLKQAYGEEFGSIQTVRLQYMDKEFLASAKDAHGNSSPFSYWDSNPKNQFVSTVLRNGSDIGGSHAGSSNSIIVEAAHFNEIDFKIGNNIMPNIGLQVAESSADGSTVWHNLDVATVPHQLTTHGPSDHAPTAQDIVTTAQFFANVAHNVNNANDCHFIATDIAASVERH